MPTAVQLPQDFDDSLTDAEVVAAVTETQSRLESYWGPLHKAQDRWSRIYSLLLEVGVPNGYNVVYPDTGNSVIETAADHITGEDPLIKVPVVKEHEGARLQSEKLEKWLQASLYRFRDSMSFDPIRGVVTDLLWAGQVVSQGPIFLSDAWGDDPKTRATSMTAAERKTADEDYAVEKKMNWPFMWRLIDPRWVFADPGTHGRKYVIIKYLRNVGEVREFWSDWDGKKPNSQERYNDTDEVEFYEYWDAKYKVYIAGGDLLFKGKHSYGKPPFQIKGAGKGKSSGTPLEKYQSMLFAADAGGNGMIVQEIRAACQFDAVMRNAAWTMMLTPQGSKFKKLEPGKTQPMDPKHIELTRPVTEIKTEVVTALRQEQQWVAEKLQGATYPKVAAGQGVSGSGYLNNSLAALAKMKFTPFINAAQQTLSQFFADLLTCVEEEVGEVVPAFGPTKTGWVDLAIGPDDIKGMRYVLVNLHPKMPVDRANEVQIGHMLKADGAIDDDTYIEDYAGYEQPEEMRVRIRRDRIMQSPLIQGILNYGAAVETGMITFIKEQAVAAGLDPTLVEQSLIQNLLQMAAPPASPDGTPSPGGGGGGAQNATNGSGGGTADTTLFPTSKTQPTPGSMSIPSQSAAARGAGVPTPKGGR